MANWEVGDYENCYSIIMQVWEKELNLKEFPFRTPSRWYKRDVTGSTPVGDWFLWFPTLVTKVNNDPLIIWSGFENRARGYKCYIITSLSKDRGTEKRSWTSSSRRTSNRAHCALHSGMLCSQCWLNAMAIPLVQFSLLRTPRDPMAETLHRNSLECLLATQ